MNLPGFIEFARASPSLDFLLIGGYAVAAHGHTRATFDVDFLIRRSDQDSWKAKARTISMQIQAESNTFIQFHPIKKGTNPLGLMIVADEIFAKLRADAEPKQFGSVEVLVPSLDHLIALKLHVLKQGLAHRTYKDAEDVEMLLRRNKLDITMPKYEELFLKYGSEKSTKPSSASFGTDQREPAQTSDFVDLPYDPNFVSRPPQVSIEVMLKEIAFLRSSFPNGIPTDEERLRAKVNVEFKL